MLLDLHASLERKDVKLELGCFFGCGVFVNRFTYLLKCTFSLGLEDFLPGSSNIFFIISALTKSLGFRINKKKERERNV